MYGGFLFWTNSYVEECSLWHLKPYVDIVVVPTTDLKDTTSVRSTCGMKRRSRRIGKRRRRLEGTSASIREVQTFTTLQGGRQLAVTS